MNHICVVINPFPEAESLNNKSPNSRSVTELNLIGLVIHNLTSKSAALIK